jgi:hypothetical protein
MGPSRVYNALQGDEVKKIILREVEQAFNEVADFRPSVAFPVLRWQWNLKIDCYPRDPQNIEIQKTGAHVATDATDEELTSTQPIELSGQNAVGAAGMLAPDQAREEAGLPVPTLRRDRSGNLVDVMETKAPADPDEAQWRPKGVRSAVVDKGRDRKI